MYSEHSVVGDAIKILNNTNLDSCFDACLNLAKCVAFVIDGSYCFLKVNENHLLICKFLLMHGSLHLTLKSAIFAHVYVYICEIERRAELAFEKIQHCRCCRCCILPLWQNQRCFEVVQTFRCWHMMEMVQQVLVVMHGAQILEEHWAQAGTSCVILHWFKCTCFNVGSAREKGSDALVKFRMWINIAA